MTTSEPTQHDESGHVLGADMGGTRTRVALGDAQGRIVHLAESGPGNPVRVGPNLASTHLREAVAATLLSHPGTRVTACCVGMAGVSHPSATGVVRAALAQLVEPPVRVLRDDGAIALRAAHGAAPGVLVMAGTGSGAQAQGPEGWHRTGGWGPVLGDEGSAHAIGLAALRAIVRAEDGRLPRTVLTERVMATVEHPEVRMLPFLLKQERIDLPQLFILVDEAAREGDETARGILEAAARDLASLAEAVARLAGVPAGATVATTGSVIGFSVVLRDALMEAIEASKTGLRRGPHIERPVEGAVAWALDAQREDPVPIADW